MRRIGLLKAIHLVKRYPKLDPLKKRKIRNERLRALVEYARENSPYYNNLYSHLRSGWELEDLPTVSKAELMENFDDVMTDRKIHIEEIHRFMEDKGNIGSKYIGKYQVFTTSGSSGEPAVVLYDDTTMNVASALELMRSFARKSDMKAFITNRRKAAGLFAEDGFYLACGSVASMLKRMPWEKRQMTVISVLKPMDEIVEELNRFLPTMLGGYPTTLELLIDEKKEGRLNIAPVLIMAEGENLDDDLRARLSEAFGCYAQANYSCTEGGAVACECRLGHFHINEDWVIVEPVDENNNTVAPGELASKILLTNLANYTQPFIRYEVTDRVIIHRELCSCGNNNRFLEIVGRTDDILEFAAGGKKVRVAPTSLYALLKEYREMRRFQLILHEKNRLELRVLWEREAEREKIFEECSAVLKKYLEEAGIQKMSIELSEKLPALEPGSGKYKHVFQEI